MPHWDERHALLSPELHHLVIDSMLAEETSIPLRCNQLAKCALVNKSWYAYSTRLLWRELEIRIWDDGISQKKTCGLLEAALANPQRMSYIKHVSLDMISQQDDIPEDTHTRPLYASRPDFFALCNFLPAVPKLGLKHNFISDDDVMEPPNINGGSPDPRPTRMAYLLAPFFQSSILTAFCFTGRVLPLRLLMTAPNLRNLDLSHVEDCDPDDDVFPIPPFRLTRARFFNSPSIATRMAYGLDRAFSRLEDLEVKQDAWDDLRAFYKLFGIAQGTLQHLTIEGGGSICKLVQLGYLLNTDVECFRSTVLS